MTRPAQYRSAPGGSATLSIAEISRPQVAMAATWSDCIQRPLASTVATSRATARTGKPIP